MSALKFGKHNGGSAILTVLLVVLISSMVLGTITGASMHRAFMARKLADRTKALAIAEAGASQAYSVLVTNFSARTNPAAFPETVFHHGTYDVTVVAVGDDVAVITSTGTCENTMETVVLDVKNYGGGGSEGYAGTVSDYAILCGGTFYFRGCGNVSGTNGTVMLHSNGKMDIRGDATAAPNVDIRSATEIAIGNNIDIYGDVTAPVLTYKASKVDFYNGGQPSEEAVPEVDIPDIDLTPYCTLAAANNEVVNGDYTLSNDSYTPDGGVLWVDGNVHISGHSTFNGSIIATGNIHISGQTDVTAGAYVFALASREGSITYTSTGQAEGLIYAKNGNYSQTANGNVRGQIIIKGNIDKGGNSDVLLYEQAVLNPPGTGTGGGDLIGISAWQK